MVYLAMRRVYAMLWLCGGIGVHDEHFLLYLLWYPPVQKASAVILSVFTHSLIHSHHHVSCQDLHQWANGPKLFWSENGNVYSETHDLLVDWGRSCQALSSFVNGESSWKVGKLSFQDAIAAGTESYFDGMLDEIGIFDFVLRAADIGFLYNSFRPSARGSESFCSQQETQGLASWPVGADTSMLLSTTKPFLATSLHAVSVVFSELCSFTRSKVGQV